jgi:hypothetical protein
VKSRYLSNIYNIISTLLCESLTYSWTVYVTSVTDNLKYFDDNSNWIPYSLHVLLCLKWLVDNKVTHFREKLICSKRKKRKKWINKKKECKWHSVQSKNADKYMVVSIKNHYQLQALLASLSVKLLITRFCFGSEIIGVSFWY